MRNVAIIGRQDEIEALESFVSRVPVGFEALALEGEAGVGKTTLWQAAVDRARAAGVRVLVARPTEAEATLAFGGLADLLSGAAADVVDALPEIQRRALEAVLLLGEAPAEADERVVGAGTLSALRALAGRGPVCVAVDDIQWLDVPSAHALEFALRRLRAEPFGFLTAIRIEPGATGIAALARSIGAERVERLSVGPLSVGALYELIQTRLGLGLSRPALLRLHDLSGGNPFFALELARASADVPDLPRDLRRLLRARIAALSSTAADVIVVAAALRDPSVDVIERVLPGVDVNAALRRLRAGSRRSSRGACASPTVARRRLVRRCFAARAA